MPKIPVVVRRARGVDSPEIARLFYETVHRINSRDYSTAQLSAWAPKVYPDSFWRQRAKTYHLFVALHAGVVVGFGELRRDGYIGCLYTHHAWQRRGLGSRLLQRIEAEALRLHIRWLRADVSVTAMPFFKRSGFQVIRWQKRVYRNQSFRQFLMEKRIGSCARTMRNLPRESSGPAEI